MAKTRMKTTPTRLQKDAGGNLTAEDIKKRLRQINATPAKEPLHVTSTIVVPAPKRTNSISSVTSSISLASDTQSVHSDSEFVANARPTATTAFTTTTLTTTATTTESAAPEKTLDSLLSKQNNSTLKNRKVFMITEKCDGMNSNVSPNSSNNNNHTTSTCQKRKMYLIMEDSHSQSQLQQQQQQQSTNSIGQNDQAESLENEFKCNPTKKLTLFTDKCDAKFTHKFEQILPEILNRINNKVKDQTATATTTTAATIKQNGHQPMLARSANCTPFSQLKYEALRDADILETAPETIRLPITLPPKKNRMKIINTAATPCNTPTISAATPVIVSTTNFYNASKCSNGIHAEPAVVLPAPPPLHKNINLSTDFLFLMKMLPKLESIPEPHKSHVKNCIEKIVTQNASIFVDH